MKHHEDTCRSMPYAGRTFTFYYVFHAFIILCDERDDNHGLDELRSLMYTFTDHESL
jgi:hypothetical protein